MGDRFVCYMQKKVAHFYKMRGYNTRVDSIRPTNCKRRGGYYPPVFSSVNLFWNL